MSTIRILGLVICVVVLSLVAVQGDVITINGSDSDWGSPDTTNDDPRDAWYDSQWNDEVDINLNYYEWDYETGNGYCAFAFETYATMPANSAGDYVEVLINTDKDTGTGGTRHSKDGFEYAIYYDLHPTTPDVKLYEYNGSWSEVSGADVDAQRVASTDFVEFHVLASDIGFPSTFQWGIYYDNDDNPPDDWCPDDADQDGYTPEPATMTLFGLGLVGLGAWRRRRSAA